MSGQNDGIYLCLLFLVYSNSCVEKGSDEEVDEMIREVESTEMVRSITRNSSK